jgi:23S rRNA U2552 (ribose-2'-O)-methylase RlmE/FtsJ
VSEQGWANPYGDEYFKQQRQRADSASCEHRRIFFNMMQQIGDEIQAATGVLALKMDSPEVLDLCMAPGGYTASILKFNPHAHVSGITLPEQDGGHELLVRWGSKDTRVEVTQLDITMLSSEFGVEDIPDDHPDKVRFLYGERPYRGKSFDLAFCDGQVLRTHARATYRECKEALRLTCSQLVLTMQRIRPGGTMIILLHKLDAWDSINLLFNFSKFAHIQLFKPKRKHRLRSSFYLVATDVNPNHPDALSVVAKWKNDWKEATFTYNEDKMDSVKAQTENSHEASHVLAEFGSTLIKLAEPIWAIQRDGLRDAAFIQKEKTGCLEPLI